jgi:metal-responsive CopG/Arc/MetJ family transcriptional regulator
MNFVHLGIRVEEKLRTKLRRLAKMEHKSLSELIRDILYDYIEKAKKPKVEPVETKEE